MRQIRKTDTKPELVVRKLVHAMGFRFRLHGRGLPGTPDLVFASRKKVILVHGCFWHQHNCRLGGKTPSSNRDYWRPKLARNVERDAENLADLAKLGWSTLVIWECETKSNQLERRLLQFLDSGASVGDMQDPSPALLIRPESISCVGDDPLVDCQPSMTTRFFGE
jgi:DNA mismatch endonuclease (patch repair protein)